ncbi:glycosyltransferase family 4 protein [Patescibacteria group bacterium]|nr:glycosyltransferase family 4 protein [Patescibacteria group bacterium]
MVIGIDIRTFVISQLTGIGIYTWEILNHLFKENTGTQYKLFYNQGFGRQIKQVQEFKNYPNVSLHYHRWPNKFLNFSLKYFKGPCLDELLGGTDIFWFPNLNFWQVSHKSKTIITIHDLSFIRLPWAYSPKMRWWHKLIDLSEKLKSADKIIAVSANTKNDLIELYKLPQDKIEVIYSAVSAEPKANNLISIKQKYNLPNKFILFLGTLEPRKNVEGIIQAFKSLNQIDVDLVIAGGQGWLYKRIYQKANQSKLKNRIHFIGYIKPDDRFAFYKMAQALVWPSFYEGFGFPPLEAMSCGCPVITSANSSLPEVVGNAALLVDPYNINEISLAINQILTSSQLRQNLINKGYEQVKKFDWQTSAKKMAEVFRQIE